MLFNRYILGVFLFVFILSNTPFGMAKTTEQRLKDLEKKVSEISPKKGAHFKIGDVNLTLGLQANSWFMTQTNPYFTKDPAGEDKQWAETFGYAKILAQYQDFYAGEIRLLGERTSGQDPYGTNTTTTDPVTSTAPATVLDIERAYVKVKKILNYPFDFTIGRQEIIIGDGFIVADGVFDRQSIYYNPRTSFDAARLVWSPFKSTSLDTFVSFIDATNDAQGDQTFYGANLTQKIDSIQGRYDLGFFYRTDSSGNSSGVPDPKTLSMRAEQGFKFLPDLQLSGEFVYQFGQAQGAQALTTGSVTVGSTSDIEAFAGHATAKYTFSKMKYAPFIEGSYIHFSGDDVGTAADYEGYTPLYPGFMDWNKWFVGDVMAWTIFNTNENILKLQAGFWPRQDVSIRGFYMNFWLDKKPNNSTEKHFAQEFNLVFDYFATEHLWLGGLFAAVLPDKTAGVANIFNLNILGTQNDFKGMIFASLTL